MLSLKLSHPEISNPKMKPSLLQRLLMSQQASALTQDFIAHHTTLTLLRRCKHRRS